MQVLMNTSKYQTNQVNANVLHMGKETMHIVNGMKALKVHLNISGSMVQRKRSGYRGT